MAPLEQQWVKVQQKTFTKWCVGRPLRCMSSWAVLTHAQA
jgi:hypothetical protein